jgi:hypothetical protein
VTKGHYALEEVLEYSVLDILADYGSRFKEFLPRIYRIYHSHINRYMEDSFDKSGRPIVLAKNVPKVLDKYDLDYQVEKGRRVDYLIRLKVEDVQRLEQAKASLRNELFMALR